MGGPARLLLSAAGADKTESLIPAVTAEVERLEAQYSRYRNQSLVSRINASAGSGAWIGVDDEFQGLCGFIDQLHAQSGGLFDPTAGPLTRAWDFRKPLPSDRTIARMRNLTGWSRFERRSDDVRLPEAGMELDFGGVVKEYAADAVIRILIDAGIKHALVEMAGDVATLGAGPEGRPWQVGIRSPRGKGALGTLALDGLALASSGDYERGRAIGGERYGHCVDPRSGRLVEGPVAVTVLAAQCLLAGAAATTAMLQPVDDAVRWLESLALPWLLVARDLSLRGPLTEELDITQR